MRIVAATALLAGLVSACRPTPIAEPERRAAFVEQARRELESISQGRFRVVSLRPAYEARLAFPGGMNFEERYYALGFEAEVDMPAPLPIDTLQNADIKVEHPDWPYGDETKRRVEVDELFARVAGASGRQRITGVALFDEQLADRFVSFADTIAPPPNTKVTRHEL